MLRGRLVEAVVFRGAIRGRVLHAELAVPLAEVLDLDPGLPRGAGEQLRGQHAVQVVGRFVGSQARAALDGADLEAPVAVAGDEQAAPRPVGADDHLRGIRALDEPAEDAADARQRGPHFACISAPAFSVAAIMSHQRDTRG